MTEHTSIVEMYARLLADSRTYFSSLESGSAPSAARMKRLVQRIAEEIPKNGDAFVGLINLRLVPSQAFVHGVNVGIYAMVLANAIGLGPADLVRCGMTAHSQGIERVREPAPEVDHAPESDRHFESTVASIAALCRVAATDRLSGLRVVTTYERGFPFNTALPERWYRGRPHPHLLSRIIEIARHYDLLTLGLDGTPPQPPDRALRTMMVKMGSHYDSNLMRVFVNVVGLYPVGSLVELSDGYQAIVVRSPALSNEQNLSNAGRPVVSLLGASDHIIDLSLPQHGRLQIARLLDRSEADEAPGAARLMT